ADLNGDGRPDVVVVPPSGPPAVLLNRTVAGSPTLAFDPPVPLPASSAAALALADLNGDGRPDVVFAAPSGPPAVLLNRTVAGSPTLAFDPPVPLPASSAAALALADLNGDGRPDVVVAPPSGPPAVLLNRTVAGSGLLAFDPPAPLPATS